MSRSTLRLLAPAVLLGLALCGCTVRAASPPSGPHDATAHHPFDDPAYWSKVFDDPHRDAWQKPDALVQALHLRPGMTVADLGAGTGYFEKRLSAAVGPRGTVFAVETEPNLIAHLRTRAEREGTANVTPLLASFDDPRLPPASVDVMLIVDTYHHVDDRLTYFRKLRAVMKPGGRVAIVEWRKEPLPEGPPLEHKIARELVLDEMRQTGWTLVEEPTVLQFQYFVIFAVGATTDAP